MGDAKFRRDNLAVVFVLLLTFNGIVTGGAVGGPKDLKLKAYYGKHVTTEIEYEGGKIAHLAISGGECGSVRIIDNKGDVVRSGRMKFTDQEEDGCLYDADEFAPTTTAKYTIDV